jgi:tripartite-type tricarboxylate transporter receptor subunit TctC
VSVLGITGNKVVNGYQPLVKQGFNNSFAQMNVGHHLLVPKTIDSEKHKEFYDIFAQAAKTESVIKAYAVDYCEPQTVQYNELNNFFNFHTDYWKKLSSGIKIN